MWVKGTPDDAGGREATTMLVSVSNRGQLQILDVAIQLHM